MKPELTQAERDKELRVQQETERFWELVSNNPPIFMKDRWAEIVTQMRNDSAVFAPLFFCLRAGYSTEKTLTVLLIDHWLIKKGMQS